MFSQKIIAYTSDHFPKYKVVPFKGKGKSLTEQHYLDLYTGVIDNPRGVLSSVTPISGDVGFLNFNGQDMIIFSGEDGYSGTHIGFAFVDSLEKVKEELEFFPMNSSSVIFKLGLLPDLFINEMNE